MIEESFVKRIAVILFSLLAGTVACAQTQPAKPAQSTKPPGASQPGTPQGGPAAAGTPAGLAGVDPAKEADIRRLLDVMGSQALMTQVMGNLETDMKPMLMKSLPPGDYREKLVDLFFEKFMARVKTQMPSLLDAMIIIYDKYFSDEDIKGLIQFYQTPLGQKTLSNLPKVVRESQAAGEKLGAKMGLEAMQDVMSEHPELKQEMEDAQKSQSK